MSAAKDIAEAFAGAFFDTDLEHRDEDEEENGVCRSLRRDTKEAIVRIKKCSTYNARMIRAHAEALCARAIDAKQYKAFSRRDPHHYMYNEERDSSSYWEEVAYELTQYRLWTKFKNHARVVGKSAVVLSELYKDISMRPPHGQEYMVAAKRFKSMVTPDPRASTPYHE